MDMGKDILLNGKKQEMIDYFLTAVAALETLEDCKRFFSIVCTPDEIEKIARRILIARLIINGETYRSIIEKTNASNLTISRLKGVLQNDESILTDVLKRIES